MNRRKFLENLSLSSIALPIIIENVSAQQIQKTLENFIVNDPSKIEGTDLLTTPVFDGKYNSVTTNDKGNDELVAKELFKYSLQDTINKEIIKKDMLDLALPLGVYNKRTSTVDYNQGMKDMWNRKKGISWQGTQGNILRQKRDHFIQKLKKNNKKTTLRSYRSCEITKSCEIIEEIFEGKKQQYGPTKKAAMKEIVENISPNVLLSYNIQELIPPAYKKKQINPVFKTYFLDRLLKEGGLSLIEGYPARYDHYLSYGPFQLTKFAMPEIAKYNKYLSEKNKIPKKMNELRNIQDHSNAAAVFAYRNWESLINKCSRSGLLNKFNRKFPKVDKAKKQTFIAGITACMHHAPNKTMTKTCYYLSDGDYNKIDYGVRRLSFSGSVQLQKYYDSSAESYLLLKVFHNLDDKYSK